MCRALLRFPHLSFIPPVPYSPLRGTFPSSGRLCIGDSNSLANGALETISHSLSYRHCPIRLTSLATFPLRGRLYVEDSDALIYDTLETIFSLSFIPLVPYPARFARPLPHAGKALSVVILFSHMRVFALTLWGKRFSRIVAFPLGEGGPRQRWIECSRKRRT